jgi:Bacterial DNA polymerase III alpha NTPase domain
MKRDQYLRPIIEEQDIIALLYQNPNADLSNVYLEDPSKHNDAVKANFSEIPLIKQLEALSIDPKEWHQTNQAQWFMPDEYKNLDIAAWVLEQCNGNEAELQRCGQELLEYASRDLLPLLQYLKYLIDTMRQNNVVWGVGRGSSTASFVLFKIGVHRIDSIKYDLPIEEFFKELIS